MIELKRQKHNVPELSEMLFDLEDFLTEDSNPSDDEWRKNFNAIVDFQDSDGSFRLFDSWNIPADARVDFCYMPTYICTAVLMKAYLTDSSSFTLKEKSALSKGLKMSCSRNLRGHGFEALKSQIKALNIFFTAGLNEFIDLHSDMCPEFSRMIGEIREKFHDMESRSEFLGSWGENYEDEIRAVNEYFSHRNVFVYGTLMKGEDNENYLKNSTFTGPAFIEGYDMYSVGWYPAIVEGNSMIIGELYRVPLNDMSSIDMLEGEGNLYAKKCETVSIDGKTAFALVYVYLGDVSGLKKISAWSRKYVWYVSYGSNMLRERFMCYIKGGSYEGSAQRSACIDTTLPLAVKTVEIPYEMYFGNFSNSWQNGGVSFLDSNSEGKSLGVAYLITRRQFEHVAGQENGGRFPGGGQWYEDFISLGEMDGIEMMTITNNALRPYNEPCSSYLNTLYEGIRQNWPEMSDRDIWDYLENCIRR